MFTESLNEYSGELLNDPFQDCVDRNLHRRFNGHKGMEPKVRSLMPNCYPLAFAL